MGNLSVLLLCDVVDSTQLGASMSADAHAALWERHDREARGLIRHWRGREIDKTDGFLLLFGDAADALGFAGDYHAALAAIDARLRARIGIHAGEFPLRAVPATEVARGARPIEIEGMARWIVARVAGVAPAGATVMCAAAAAALPPPRTTRSIGFWRMKGLQEPMQLFAAGSLPVEAHIEAPKAFRVVRVDDLWLPARLAPHSLPAERDQFVGRRPELDELRRRLDGGVRLLTLVGMGGAGKTRLAQRFGWMTLGEFPGGVWFCDLTQARNGDGVASATALALGIPLAAGDPVTQVGHAIAGRDRCLVVLDNFEQILQHARATVGVWLDVAAQATFVVTSREVLSLPGEHVMSIDPLPRNEAAMLFELRADAAAGRSTTGVSRDDAVGRLVELLDGLPLAIELAAARTRLMSPSQLLLRMRDRFTLLRSRGGRQERHATLRATLDWSWDLLSDSEMSALAQLSVFEGGFTLDAAEAVVDFSMTKTAPSALETVQSLLEKSLVRERAPRRFEMLMTVREYAAERLSASGPARGVGSPLALAAVQRHWRYFGDLTEAQCVADGCADADNIVAACRRAIATADGRAIVQSLRNTWTVVALRGPYSLAVELAKSACVSGAIDRGDRATVRQILGHALFMMGRGEEALDAVNQGLSLVREDDDLGTASALWCLLGELRNQQAAAAAAVPAIERAVVLARRSKQTPLICRALNAAALLKLQQGSLGQARAIFEEALRVSAEAGDHRWRAGILGNVALVDYQQGKIEACIGRYKDALAISQASGDTSWEGNATCNLGLLLHETGDNDQARKYLERAVSIARAIGHWQLESTSLCNLGLVAEATGDLRAAQTSYTASVQTAIRAGDLRQEASMRRYCALSLARSGLTTAARDCLAIAQARADQVADGALSAMISYAYAETETLAGNLPYARQCIERATTTLGQRPDPDGELAREHERLMRLLARAVAGNSGTTRQSSTD